MRVAQAGEKRTALGAMGQDSGRQGRQAGGRAEKRAKVGEW